MLSFNPFPLFKHKGLKQTAILVYVSPPHSQECTEQKLCQMKIKTLLSLTRKIDINYSMLMETVDFCFVLFLKPLTI